ncbi:hypothetical protein [Parashewanella tropica]|uniref:hypothetical protein n=1 Tax=Parashewanella tropica TaxID=2547970 RepID=UPI00105A9C7D|nr:hypothetical protein [Parashewanella tropica]
MLIAEAGKVCATVTGSNGVPIKYPNGKHYFYKTAEPISEEERISLSKWLSLVHFDGDITELSQLPSDIVRRYKITEIQELKFSEKYNSLLTKELKEISQQDSDDFKPLPEFKFAQPLYNDYQGCVSDSFLQTIVDAARKGGLYSTHEAVPASSDLIFMIEAVRSFALKGELKEHEITALSEFYQQVYMLINHELPETVTPVIAVAAKLGLREKLPKKVNDEEDFTGATFKRSLLMFPLGLLEAKFGILEPFGNAFTVNIAKCIASFERGVIELNARSGVLSHALRRQGIRVKATTDKTVNSTIVWPEVHVSQQSPIEAIAKYGERWVYVMVEPKATDFVELMKSGCGPFVVLKIGRSLKSALKPIAGRHLYQVVKLRIPEYSAHFSDHEVTLYFVGYPASKFIELKNKIPSAFLDEPMATHSARGKNVAKGKEGGRHQRKGRRR